MEPNTNQTDQSRVRSARSSKKVRLYVILGLLVVVAILAFLFESLRLWMLGIGAVLLLALGLETTETDIDMGTLFETGSVEESMIERDENGNLETTAEGDFVTKVWRDINGNEVAEGTVGAKSEDMYNCEDFNTQADAQVFYDNAGGVEADVNRLDGDKDGEPCESLPAN